jgi:hypothetical protein
MVVFVNELLFVKSKFAGAEYQRNVRCKVLQLSAAGHYSEAFYNRAQKKTAPSWERFV